MEFLHVMYVNLQNSVKATSIWYPFDTQTMCFDANDINPICFQTFEKLFLVKLKYLISPTLSYSINIDCLSTKQYDRCSLVNDANIDAQCMGLHASCSN